MMQIPTQPFIRRSGLDSAPGRRFRYGAYMIEPRMQLLRPSGWYPVARLHWETATGGGFSDIHPGESVVIKTREEAEAWSIWMAVGAIDRGI
jgi:hypothetical protein